MSTTHDGHRIPGVGETLTTVPQRPTIVAEKVAPLGKDGIRRSVVLCVRSDEPKQPYVTWSRWVSIGYSTDNSKQEYVVDSCAHGHYISSFEDAYEDFQARQVH